MRYENLPPEARAEAAHAACRFLLRNDYVSLVQACEDRSQTLQELWDEIMAQASLPPCDIPAFAMAV